ncbi:MAG: CRISPR-associated endonuclease Cas2 [Myxococcales bacterium]|nr:CRISPR-associated endonuclease Cas2 [Myxococcales bacterium]
MHLVVCYDVVCDKRRSRLHKRLKGLLHPVQKSVFEGPLPDRRYPDLLRIVLRTIDPQTDTVRVYHLTPAALALTELLGTAAAIAPEPEDVIV